MSFYQSFEIPDTQAALEGADACLAEAERVDLLAGAIGSFEGHTGPGGAGAPFAEAKADSDTDMVAPRLAAIGGGGGGGGGDDLASALRDIRGLSFDDMARHVPAPGAAAGGVWGASAAADAKPDAKAVGGAHGAKGGAKAEGGGGGGGYGGGAAESKAQAKRKLAKRAHALERKKANSTSTLFVRSTISVPDVDKILLSVAVLLDQMVVPAPDDLGTDPFLRLMGDTEERVLWERSGRRLEGAGGDTAVREFSVDNIFHFMKSAFRIAQWSPECNVLAMVLLTRLVGSTQVTFNERNWEKLLLCSLLLAQKLWDDTPLANVDFPELWRQIYPNLGATGPGSCDLLLINQMERLFLEKLHYDIHVDRATYTKFYFELHALTDDKGQFALKPLGDRQARHLEARTRDMSSSFSRNAEKAQLRSQSKHRRGEHTVALGEAAWEVRAGAKDDLCGRYVLS
jgi:hypothetical protein